MKIFRKVSATVLICAVLLTMVSSCGSKNDAGSQACTNGTVVMEPMDITLEMLPLSEGPPAMFTLLMPAASGTSINKNTKAEIDFSNTKDGYVMVRFLQQTRTRLVVRIIGPDNESYTYTLRADGKFDVYPLAQGNGKYTVGVFEQVDGTRFATVISSVINVTLTDEFAPFLRPNIFVNFNEESKVVAKAAELVKDTDDLPDKIASVYNHVIKYISYDRELARTVQSGYVPDLDAVLERGKGICFDYAAVMTAMLRSRGIPTRLVFGYAGAQYHAWIDVFSEEEGWVNSVIFFDGDNWVLMDPTWASGAAQAGNRQFIGDGANYTVKHLF